jgi:hypothetical protein
LFLVEALQLLDPVSPTYALDVLSLVESILENPDLVLWAQLDKAKGEKVAELKAQGVEYDKRMEELEKVEYPKPLAELIYGSFDSFAAKHPWVGHENVKPKSVARELCELAATFNDYIKDYSISRGEGVLLRYLTDAYKTLLQNVPEGMRDEVMADVLAFLRATVRSTDASLLEEWEAMRSGEGVERVIVPTAEPRPAPKLDLAKHPKALAARVRAELHRLVRVLAMRQYEEALELVVHSGGWTTERLEAELKPYFAAHPAIDTTPRARAPHLTFFHEDEPRVWTVRQSLLDPTGESDFMLECVVDLRGRTDPDEPLIDLRRVGS